RMVGIVSSGRLARGSFHPRRDHAASRGPDCSESVVWETGRAKIWWASQVLAWFSWREPWELESGEWPTEMGPEIVAAQLELSEKIAAGRIRLWGRRPGSAEFKQISNDLFSLSKYKVVVTPHGDLSTEPPRKRPEFEAEYEDDCKWHDIKFDEDEIRAERRPAGRAGVTPGPPRLPA